MVVVTPLSQPGLTAAHTSQVTSRTVLCQTQRCHIIEPLQIYTICIAANVMKLNTCCRHYCYHYLRSNKSHPVPSYVKTCRCHITELLQIYSLCLAADIMKLNTCCRHYCYHGLISNKSHPATPSVKHADVT